MALGLSVGPFAYQGARRSGNLIDVNEHREKENGAGQVSVAFSEGARGSPEVMDGAAEPMSLI